ncbi:MAG: ExbD/TolR family protein, partial [Gammaproteobacteria bacterium]|nr:ExbD/TolR family protein [Gammaproteobacteria bacterium]NIR97818.1 ExbD/TolR family protein [Gammaproteobacteria bacterium]NIT63518.1 ExbD/TolR family protein [Gammaproteobacteria bacterium]NIV20465.1 protein TolR [Gammaproteobacteria bacterium]NIX11047.1 protein TolR [Gammaproteobacteria bacterium]
MARQRIRKRPMSEINVVPYIDVMLVLLVIFMITTPLLTSGVDVELPQAAARPVRANEQKPVVVSVDAGGNYYVDVGEDPDQPVDAETLMARVAAVLRHRPDTPVMVKGDRGVPYGEVVTA